MNNPFAKSRILACRIWRFITLKASCMKAITESGLALLLESQAVKQMHIVQNEEGKYRVIVKLHNQEEELEPVTFRKKTRYWASLDRLTKHIREKYGSHIPNINLSLYLGDQHVQVHRQGNRS